MRNSFRTTFSSLALEETPALAVSEGVFEKDMSSDSDSRDSETDGCVLIEYVSREVRESDGDSVSREDRFSPSGVVAGASLFLGLSLDLSLALSLDFLSLLLAILLVFLLVLVGLGFAEQRADECWGGGIQAREGLGRHRRPASYHADLADIR